MPTLLNNLLQEGKLPTVETVVSFENSSITKLSIALILVIAIAILTNAVVKKLA